LHVENLAPVARRSLDHNPFDVVRIEHQVLDRTCLDVKRAVINVGNRHVLFFART
jgi:hypothetical protein